MGKRLLLVFFLSVLMAGMSHQQQQYGYRQENPISLWVPELPVPPSFARPMMAFLYSNYPSAHDNRYNMESNSKQREDDLIDIGSINEESPDAQSRKNMVGYRNNIKPSISQTQQEQVARFFFPYYRQPLLEPVIQSTVSNLATYSNKMRTATFTVTINATTAIITSCIPQAAFADAAAQSVLCAGGRKRRDVEALDHNGDETHLADIVPSRIEILVPTAYPNSANTREFHKEHMYGPVESSKEENEMISEVGDVPSSVQRDKRLFFDGHKDVYVYYPVTTTTVTSYSFGVTTCTQQLQFAAGVLACRPSQLSVCA